MRASHSRLAAPLQIGQACRGFFSISARRAGRAYSLAMRNNLHIRSTRVQVLLKPTEFASIRRGASIGGQSLSAFCRQAALNLAQALQDTTPEHRPAATNGLDAKIERFLDSSFGFPWRDHVGSPANRQPGYSTEEQAAPNEGLGPTQ